MQALLRLKDKALETGYTLEGWRYLVAVEMGLKVGDHITRRELALLRDRASDPDFARYCNRKAAPNLNPTEDTTTAHDLFE